MSTNGLVSGTNADDSRTDWVRAGVDVGGTKMLCVLTDSRGSILAKAQEPTPWGDDHVARGTIAVVAEAMSVLRAERGDSYKLGGIGVGIPGTVDKVTGTVVNAVNLGIDSMPLGKVLQEAFAVPVVVENDVNAAALGAYHLYGKGVRIFVFLNLGTGVAAGSLIDGHLLEGSSGVAGEIGHIVIEPGGDLCGCGQCGCIETEISGSALQRRWPVKEGFPMVALLKAVRAGDPKAEAVWRRFGEGLTKTVQVLTLALDPSMIVLGGGVTHAVGATYNCFGNAVNRVSKESPFVSSLKMDSRLLLADPDVPVGATGAALLTEGEMR
jgi:predicted NBD/HSP70 family sugar kinase